MVLTANRRGAERPIGVKVGRACAVLEVPCAVVATLLDDAHSW